MLKRILPVLALAAAVAFGVARADALLEVGGKYLGDGHQQLGTVILMGLPDPDVWGSYGMPLTPLALALLRRLPDTAARACLLGLELSVPFLAFLLGAALESTTCGWLSLLAALALVPLAPVPLENSLETLLYASLLLLVARALVWRARQRSPAATFVLAITMLATLLVRSPLAFFPAVLLADDWRRNPSWKTARAAAPLFWVPLLLLLPWAFLNWRMCGRIIFLENGRSALNIVTGAMGLVETYPGGTNHAIWFAHLQPGDSVVLWAVRRVLEHPWPYLLSLPFRLMLFLMQQPLWLAAGAACLWLRRGREEYRALALLTAYFVVLHCLLSVEKRYFMPLWPIFGVLAAALVSRAPAPSARRRLAGVWAAALSVPLGFSAYTLGLVASYPSRAAVAATDFPRLLREHPDEPLLWHDAGKRAWTEHDTCGAISDYARALRLRPSPENLVVYAKAVMARVGARQFIFWPQSPVPAAAWVSARKASGDRLLLVESDLFQSISFSAMGVGAQSDLHFHRFAKAWSSDSCRNQQQTTMEAVPAASFRALCVQALPALQARTAGWPPVDRDQFARRLELFGCRAR